MKQKLIFLCLACGRTETVNIKEAMIMGNMVRCYFVPKDWSLLYPSQEFPTNASICDLCKDRAIIEKVRS